MLVQFQRVTLKINNMAFISKTKKDKFVKQLIEILEDDRYPLKERFEDAKYLCRQTPGLLGGFGYQLLDSIERELFINLNYEQ